MLGYQRVRVGNRQSNDRENGREFHEPETPVWGMEKRKTEAIDQPPTETQHGPQKLPQDWLLWSWSKGKLRNMTSATHRTGISNRHLPHAPTPITFLTFCPATNRRPIYDMFMTCLVLARFFSPVGIAPAEVLGLALSLASAAPWWHRLVKSRIASFSADSTASAQAWGSPPKTTVIFTAQCWLTWIESYHRNVGLDVGWIALDIRETAGWSPHSSNGELSPETPYHRACRLLAPSN